MKIKYLILFANLFFGFAIKAQPPNNAIFKGGSGDGFSKVNNAITTNNIFVGGDGDGFTNAVNLINANNIFKGGDGDGWTNEKNIVIVNNIFSGGVGDGWTNEKNISIPNTIYKGGDGDGWTNDKNTSIPNSIFNGGDGDGWSAVLVPLGPLPVSLLSFTGENLNKQNLLRWQTTNEINTSHFEVQKSINGTNFSLIGIVNATVINSTINNYTKVDSTPTIGNNFYRLKQIDNDGKFVYSNIILIRVNKNDDILSVYPNPTASELNISLTGKVDGKNVELFLIDATGKLVINKRFKKENKNLKLNVSTLAKGVYILTIVEDGEKNTIKFIKQ